MIGTVLALVRGLSEAVSRVFEYLSQGRLIELGERREAAAEQEQQLESLRKAASIDMAPPSTGSELLSRLRKPPT